MSLSITFDHWYLCSSSTFHCKVLFGLVTYQDNSPHLLGWTTPALQQCVALPPTQFKETGEGKRHTLLKAEEFRETKYIWSHWNWICPPFCC